MPSSRKRLPQPERTRGKAPGIRVEPNEGFISCPISNLVFGGPDRDTLYVPGIRVGQLE